MAQKPFLNISWNFSQVVHELFTTQHPPEGQVMQTHAGKHKLKVEVGLNMTTVPMGYFCLSGKGFCCRCCCPYMKLLF